MLSEPEIGADTEAYVSALDHLDADRDEISQSMGMAGGLLLPARIKRNTIRAEGKRLGYRGDDLDDFVAVVKALDMHFVHERRAILYREFAQAVKANSKTPRG